MDSVELPGVFPKYLDPIASTLAGTYEFVREIARGKTGIAFELRSTDSSRSYCLKTISPDVGDENEQSRVGSTLKKEIEILLPLRHRCLPAVFQHSIDSDLPFYVCSYHPGMTFQRFKQEGHTLDRDASIHVILSLIDAFEYLHASGRTHCDFHQRNALISETPFRDGILIIDFGSGHRDTDSTSDTADRGEVGFKNVDAQAHFREKVNRRDAQPAFESSDFRAFGRMLALMTDAFFWQAPNDQRIAYRDFCQELSIGEIDNWATVREHFSTVVDTRHLFSRADRLFVMRDGTRPTIALPVLGNAHVGEATLAVINTKAFQRLRLVKQLSFCEWYFPGATHTRFEHSIGVLETTREAISFLVDDPVFRGRFTQRNIDGLILAALLHDIGHYPFAHVLEHYVASRFPGNTEARDAVSHTQHTKDILRYDTEIKGVVENFWGNDLTTEAVKILDGKVSVLSDILDGPIDVDKLDYLRRDAHHCGVPFGRGVDRSGILRAYRCVQNGEHLGVSAEGVMPVEGFMVIQDQMLGTVYWQEHVRAVIAMFHVFLAHVVRTDLEALRTLATELKGAGGDHDALRDVILPRLEKLKETPLRQLVQLHCSPRFGDIYVCIARYSRTDRLPTKAHGENTVYDSILKNPSTSMTAVPIDWKATARLRKCYQDAFGEKKVAIESTDLVVDVPWGKAANRVVRVTGEGSRSEHDVTEVSHLRETVFTEPTAFLSPIRVYLAPNVYAKTASSIGSIRTSAEEKFYSYSVPGDQAKVD